MATAAVQEVVVGGTATPRRRRAGALLGALALLPAVGVLAAAPPAYAELTSVPGTMSTATLNTASFAVPVPQGVEVRALTGVVTMPEVVEGGTITFRVNGAVRETVASSLYQKVRIPLDPADVVADGTIGLTMTTEGPVPAGSACVPTGGVASMRKIELDYRGAEVAPTTVAGFFPPASAGITVVIPENGDDQMITAGLTAVAALAYRYADAPVSLSLTAPAADTASASQRVVALVEGRPGEVTTAVSTTSGIPMLTLTGTGDSLVNAARVLSTDVLGLSGSDPEDISQEVKARNTAKTRTIEDLGIDDLALTGFGSVSQRFALSQDAFGVPISSLELHLEGSHTAFPDASGARLDVRVNGDLVDSAVLGEEASFALDARVPSSKLRSVNEVQLTLNALAPDGSACTPPSIPPAEVDLDAGESTATVTHGTGKARGFQLFPQIFEGVLPVALRSVEGRQAGAAINAAALIAALQRAGGPLLEIQLMEPDAFLADDRPGMMVGALAGDSQALDAPLELSSTRLLDREDETVELTSQDPYAALESIDRNDRLVLMLGSWAPGNKAAPGELARKVVDAVVNSGWENLDGDLVIADAANPAFVAASRSLAPHQEVKEEKSHLKWFVIAIALLLLTLAFQLFLTIRRDRRLARGRYDELDEEPQTTDRDSRDDGNDQDFEVDALGDLDDLEVHDHPAEPAAVEVPTDEEDEDPDDLTYADELDDTGEFPVIEAEEYEEDDEPEPEEPEEPEPDEPEEPEPDEPDEPEEPEEPDEPEEPAESKEPVESEVDDEALEPADAPEPAEAPEPAPRPKPPVRSPRSSGSRNRTRNRRRS